MDSETNQTVVTFTLDRVGAKRFGESNNYWYWKADGDCFRW